jgi:hypothetical protein
VVPAVAVAAELSPVDAPSSSESSSEMTCALPDPGLLTKPAPVTEPATEAPGEGEAVPPELAAAALGCALEIAAAASVAASAAELVLPGVLAAGVGAAGGGAADAAAAAAVAAAGGAGGEELPDAGNCPPIDPPSEALFAAALRAGLGAS